MLDRLQRMAARLRGYQKIAALLGLLAVGLFLLAIFLVPGELGQSLSLAAITLLLWSLCLGAFISAFASPMRLPATGSGWLARLRWRLALGCRWLLAAALTVLLIAAIWWSGRAMMLAWQE